MQTRDAYVVDASVAVKWHLTDEANSDRALSLLRSFVDGEIDLVAPEHIRYEVLNAITVATRRLPARLTYARGQEAIDQFLALPIVTFSDNGLLTAAYPLAAQYGCAFDDAVYLALALRTNRPFVTADNRLYRQIRNLPLVRWLGTWQPTS